MMMKVFILALLLQCTMLFTYGQRTDIDALEKQLLKAKQDTNRVFLLAALSNQYLYSHPDSAVFIGQQAYALARQLNFLKGEALGLNRIANANLNLGNSTKALEYIQKASTISKKIEDWVGVGRALNNICNIYAAQNEYLKALQYILEAKKIFPHISVPAFHVIVLQNTGDVYYHLNQLDSATLYTEMAYSLAVKEKTPSLLSDIIRILGDIESKKKNQVKALGFYRQSIFLSNRLNDQQHKSQTYLGMAKLYQEERQVDSVLFYSKKALEMALARGFTADVLNAAQFISQVYEKRNQNNEAFHYFKIATTAKDSLFSQEKVKQMLTLGFDEKIKQQEIEAENNSYRDKLRIYILLGGLAILFVIAILLIRNNMQKQKAYKLLQKLKQETDTQKAKAEEALNKLKTTQDQLIQSEKLASLGELTAGIAHEIQNPLNFVNNFSEVNAELVDEMEEELEKGDVKEAMAIATDIKQNLEKIRHHGMRADGIVKGMLQHSRNNSGERQLTDLNVLADEYLRLSYHGLRAKDKSFNATLTTHFQENLPKVNIIPQDIGRVLLNLFNNAFYAVQQKQKTAGTDYKPEVMVDTSFTGTFLVIKVKDNGTGIPEAVRDKIMQPFFTTKPTGEGTGLGLSLSYDILVKGHGGSININSEEGKGSEFLINLPVQA